MGRPPDVLWASVVRLDAARDLEESGATPIEAVVLLDGSSVPGDFVIRARRPSLPGYDPSGGPEEQPAGSDLVCRQGCDSAARRRVEP